MNDKILFNRLIYIELFYIVLASIILIPIILIPESSIAEFILVFSTDVFFPYDLEAADEILRKGPLSQLFENTAVCIMYAGLWVACLTLLLKRKKIGVQIFYLLVISDLVYLLFSGDEIFTPFVSFMTLIETYIIGVLIYMVTFSSLKKEFK